MNWERLSLPRGRAGTFIKPSGGAGLSQVIKVEMLLLPERAGRLSSSVLFGVQVEAGAYYVKVSCSCLLHLSVGAAITKYDRQSGLNSKNVFSYSSGGWKSKIKMSAGMASPEASLLGLQTATFSLHPQVAFPLCVHL